jgi:hypothetical protein
MFDNEIDWVTWLECRQARREARQAAKDSRHVYIQGRAHASYCKLVTQASVQVRRVSLGDVTRKRVSVASYSQRRRIG